MCETVLWTLLGRVQASALLLEVSGLHALDCGLVNLDLAGVRGGCGGRGTQHRTSLASRGSDGSLECLVGHVNADALVRAALAITACGGDEIGPFATRFDLKLDQEVVGAVADNFDLVAALVARRPARLPEEAKPALAFSSEIAPQEIGVVLRGAGPVELVGAIDEGFNAFSHVEDLEPDGGLEMLGQLGVLERENNGEVIRGLIRLVRAGKSQTDVQDTGGSGDGAEVGRGTHEGPHGLGSRTHGGERASGCLVGIAFSSSAVDVSVGDVGRHTGCPTEF